MEDNQITLRGRALQAPVYSHDSHGMRFFCLPISVARLSGQLDRLNLFLTQAQSEGILPGDWLMVQGEVRSFNNRSGVGSRLVITVFAQTLEKSIGQPENTLVLSGVLCKPPIYRRTPLGREICDLMLAVPRKYGRADYLPCIAWGSSAAYASNLAVGTRVHLTGRLQSRTYTKTTPCGPEEKVAFEISVTQLVAVP